MVASTVIPVNASGRSGRGQSNILLPYVIIVLLPQESINEEDKFTFY